MRRRELLTILGGAAAWSFAAHAQTPGRMKRVAMVHPTTNPAEMKIGGDPNYAIVFQEMKRLGYVEGTNLIVDRYSAEGRFDLFSAIARDIVATRPDVIFAVADAVVLALQLETRTIPIVAWTGDPVALGIVSSLAHPGGNVTGLSVDAGVEFAGKRVELPAEAVGRPSNVRAVGTPTWWQSPSAKTTREAAEKANIPLRLEPLQTPVNEAEYRRAFDSMRRDHVDGVVVSSDAVNYTYRVLLGRLAQEFRLPAVCSSAESGALMSYAFDLNAGDRRVATQIVDILNGGSPAKMPYFQESHWELVINLKAAKELGLEIPAGLVVCADKVIE